MPTKKLKDLSTEEVHTNLMSTMAKFKALVKSKSWADAEKCAIDLMRHTGTLNILEIYKGALMK
jgi:hypothetical protein